MSQPECEALPADSVCGPEYEGFFVHGSVAEFNANITRFIDYDRQATVGKRAATANGESCELGQVRSALDTLRFFKSYQCSDEIKKAAKVCPPAAGKAATRSATLCTDQCGQLVESSTILKNTTLCGGFLAQEAISIGKFCETSPDGGKCVTGVLEEVEQCGFPPAKAKEQCAKLENDACCQDLLSNAKYWYAAGVVGLVLLLVVGAFMYIKSKRSEPASTQKTQEPKQQPAPISITAPHPSPNQQSVSKTAPVSPNLNQPQTQPYVPNNAQYQNHQPYSAPLQQAPHLQYQNTSPQLNNQGSHSADYTKAGASVSYQPPAPQAVPVVRGYDREKESAVQAFVTAQSLNAVPPPEVEPVVQGYDREKEAAVQAYVTAQGLSAVPPSSPVVSEAASLEVETETEAPRLGPKLLRVVHPYASSSEDELTIAVGMELVLLQKFDDGWAVGKIRNTKESGFFPLVCVKEFVEEITQDEHLDTPLKPALKDEPAEEHLHLLSAVKTARRISSAMSYQGAGTPTMSVADLSKLGDSVILYKVQVIHPYVPTMDDELPLTVGRVLQVIEKYDDGWGLAKDMVTEKVGAFPTICVQELKSDADLAKRISKRESSAIQNFWQYSSLDIKDETTEMKVIHPYAATADDELTLKVGSIIHQLQSFDDGWALGTDSNGNRGVFPVICTIKILSEDEDSGSAVGSVVPSERVASLVIQPEVLKGRIPISVFLSSLDELDLKK